MTLPNQILKDTTDGEYYRWDGVFPKMVSTGSTPATSGGVGKGNWVAVGDAALMAMLKSVSGATMVGTTSGDTVQDKLDKLQSGSFNLGYRSYTIKDRLDEALSVKAFGAIGDGVTDDTAAIQACIDYASVLIKRIAFPDGFYNISETLNVPSGMTIYGVSSQSTNGSKIICKKASMVAFWFHSYENNIRDLTILGFESNYQNDAVNGYGQISTCTGMRFQLDNGAKDIDSRVERCAFLALNTCIYAVGANLLIRNNSFTASIYGLDAYQAGTEDFRGFIIEGNRFHKLGGNGYSGLYPSLTNSCCIRMAGPAMAMKISDNYADFGIHRFFSGTFGQACTMSDNEVFNADADIITIDNTSVSGGYDNFIINGLSVVNQVGTLTGASGHLVNITGARSGLIANISGSAIRKGGVILQNCQDVMVHGVMLKNINAAYGTDGSVYSGVEANAGSLRIKVYDIYIRNTLNAGQSRSIVHASTDSSIEVSNISGNNVAAVISGGGRFSGNADGGNAKSYTGRSNAAPTTGTWISGDTVYNTSPGASGYIGWVCTVSGTPGTWKGFGQIAA